jgi:hypothetical protein
MSEAVVTAESLFRDPSYRVASGINCCKRGRLWVEGLLVFYFSRFRALLVAAGGKQAQGHAQSTSRAVREGLVMAPFAEDRTSTCHNSNLSPLPTHIRYIPTHAHPR